MLVIRIAEINITQKSNIATEINADILFLFFSQTVEFIETDEIWHTHQQVETSTVILLPLPC